MSIAIMSWNFGRGARALSQEVSNGRLLHKRSDRPIRQSLVLNMGLSSNERLSRYNGQLLNQPQAVRNASDKLISFQRMQGEPYCLEFTAESTQAAVWADKDGLVVVRHVVNGHSGRGIEIIRDPVEAMLSSAPLYTRAFNKTQEYRVHVGGDTIIDVRRKAKRSGLPLSEQGQVVWNHGEGFVYKIEGVTPDTVPAVVLESAVAAVKKLGLDVASVDVGYLADTGVAKVFEVNTASGMTGSTLHKYAEYLRMADGQPNNFISWELQ